MPVDAVAPAADAATATTNPVVPAAPVVEVDRMAKAKEILSSAPPETVTVTDGPPVEITEQIPTPETPVDDESSVSQPMLDRAALYGVSKEKAEELGPKALETMLDAMASVFIREQPAPAAALQPAPVQAPAPVPPAAELPKEIREVLDWTPEEKAEIDALELPKPLLARVQKVGPLEKQVAELSRKLQEQAEREHGRIIVEQLNVLDAAIGALPGADAVYGKGKSLKLQEGSEPFKARQKLMATIRTLEANFARQGRYFDDPIAELFAEADRIVRPDSAKAQAKAELEAKQKRERSMVGNRPSAAGQAAGVAMTYAQRMATAREIISRTKTA